MQILKPIVLNIIGAGSTSETCYEIYQKVANDHYGFSVHLMMSEQFGPESSAAYTFGLENALESICGDSFKQTEMAYCKNNPATCLTYKYK